MYGNFPGIAGVFLQVDMRAAVLFLHQYGHAHRHALSRRVLQRTGNAVKTCKLAQLVDGGKDEWELAAFRTCQGFGWRDPETLAGLQAVVRGQLFSRGGRDEKVRIETFGHTFRGDPVRDIAQAVGCQRQFFGARHLFQRPLLLLERLAIAIKMRYLHFWNRQYFAIAIGEQHTGFLEEFANGGGSYSLTHSRIPFGIGWRGSDGRAHALGSLCGVIILRDGAAGENIYIRHKVALDNAPHHEYFDTLACWQIPQQHDG